MKIRATIGVLLIAAFSAVALAHPTIIKVKDQKVLAEGDVSGLAVNEQAVIFSSEGAVTGFGKVVQVKGRRALLDLVVGSANEGGGVASKIQGNGSATAIVNSASATSNASVTATQIQSQKTTPVTPQNDYGFDESQAPAADAPAVAASVSSGKTGRSAARMSAPSNDDVQFFPGVRPRQSWGVAYISNDQRMNVNFTNGSVTMRGTSSGALAQYDTGWNWPVHPRFEAGLVMTELSGKATAGVCDGGKNCNYSALTLIAGGHLLLPAMQTSRWRFLLVGGGHFEAPLSQSTNAFENDGQVITTSFDAGIEGEWRLQRASWLTFGLRQTSYLIPDSSVNSGGLALFVGYSSLF